MNLRDITQAIAEGDKPTIRRAFRALVAYPEAGRIKATSPGFLVVALNKVCAALDSDAAVMAVETCEALGMPAGSSHAAGVAAAYRQRTRLSQQIIDRFAA